MQKWLLAGIIVSAFLLRVLALDRFPVGFTPDEASFGYDAFSILNTGKDHGGHGLPLVLESFGDYKPPLYAYLTIPFVWLIDLTKAAVRLPNALLGTLAVYVTYLMVRELLNRVTKRNFTQKNADLIAILSSLLLAVSPWHVMMSRGAFEANLATFFLPLAIYLFLKGLKDSRLLLWSSIAFGLNLFTYHSARLVTPLMMVVLFFLYKSEIRKILLSKLLIPGAVFVIFFITMSSTLFSGGARRAADVSVFSGALQEASGQRTESIQQGLDPTVARLFHNKYQVVVRRFLHNYTQYSSYKFLFTDGPAEATYGMIPGRGILYWFELPFIIGFVYLLFKQKNRRPLFLILLWILVAPIPAALTTGKGFAANRAAIMMPAINILSAIGAFVLYHAIASRYQGRLVKKSLLYGFISIFLIFFVSFAEDYFLLSPIKTAPGMLHGNLEGAQWLVNNSGDREVVISKKLSEPHMYIAFANKWDPVNYQMQTQDWSRYQTAGLLFVDQLGEYRLGKYTFRDIHYPVEQNLTDTLLVGKPEDFPKEVVPIQTIYYPSGDPSLLIVAPLGQAGVF